MSNIDRSSPSNLIVDRLNEVVDTVWEHRVKSSAFLVFFILALLHWNRDAETNTEDPIAKKLDLLLADTNTTGLTVAEIKQQLDKGGDAAYQKLLGDYQVLLDNQKRALAANKRNVAVNEQLCTSLLNAQELNGIIDEERRELRQQLFFNQFPLNRVGLSFDPQTCIITEAPENLPAHDAGIRVGGRVVAVDGVHVAGLPDSVRSMLIGGGAHAKGEIRIEVDHFGQHNIVTLSRADFAPSAHRIIDEQDTAVAEE